MVGGPPADIWVAVWNDVAEQLKAHREAGRAHLLTEDSVRMCTVFALERVGVDPRDVTTEVPDSVLRGGKLDLAVSTPAGRTVVELKYPRGSRSGISPDTMTLGEVLRDFLRVAIVPAVDRWVVVVLAAEIRRYLTRRGTQVWIDEQGESIVLEREVLEALPRTARDAIGLLDWRLPVHATCVVATPVDVDLALFAYRVEGSADGTIPAPLAGLVSTSLAPSGRSQSDRTDTARAQILAAIQRLVSRSGRPEVTVQEVVDEMRRAESPYAESTVRTMLTSHMCAQVHGPNIGAYNDVDRVDRGTYRLRADRS